MEESCAYWSTKCLNFNGPIDRYKLCNKEENMVSKILVAIDGSEVALRALEYAADLAKQTGATITLLSIIEKGFVPVSIPDVIAPTHLIEPVEDYLKQMAEAYVEQGEKLCKEKGVPTKRVTRSGHPVEEIIKEAEKSGVDLIVIGSHGKSALKAAVLGSVTFGVIHKDTKIPVLVVRR
jgi:nucleotide-binding universal stress UspA family protein